MDKNMTLEKRIAAELYCYQGRMSVFVDDLQGHTVEVGADEEFETASTIKAFLLAALYLQVQRGKADLSEEIEYEQSQFVDGSGMLGIKPLITIKDGKVAMAGKARGLPGAYVALFKKIDELGGVHPDFEAVAGYSTGLREVQPIENYFRDNLHMDAPLVQQIGCVIGTHAGPGAFGLAFFDKGLDL